MKKTMTLVEQMTRLRAMLDANPESEFTHVCIRRISGLLSRQLHNLDFQINGVDDRSKLGSYKSLVEGYTGRLLAKQKELPDKTPEQISQLKSVQRDFFLLGFNTEVLAVMEEQFALHMQAYEAFTGEKWVPERYRRSFNAAPVKSQMTEQLEKYLSSTAE